MHNKKVKYHTIIIFGWNTKYRHMLHHDIHDGTSELMLQIYKFNHVAFPANAFGFFVVCVYIQFTPSIGAGAV